MTTPSSDPATLFNQVSRNLGTEKLKIAFQGPGTAHIDAVLSTRAFSAAYRELQGSELKDAIVLICDATFSPSWNNPGDPSQPFVADYWIIVEPVRDGSAPYDPMTQQVMGEATPYVAGPIQNVDDALLASSAPPTVEGATTFSTGGSQTFGTSFGFFGDQLTGTMSESTTVSWGKSQTLPDVRIVNSSSSERAIIHYQIGQDISQDPMGVAPSSIPPVVPSARSTFQPQMSGLWIIPDDGQSTHPRAGDSAGAQPPADFRFHVHMIARVVAFVDRHLLADMSLPVSIFGIATHELVVQQPPLPNEHVIRVSDSSQN
ncbi:hypothetical protein [Caulobacter segnis]